MKPMSIFQVIRIDDTRVVIRHYNEETDRFEKICSARDDASLSMQPRNYRLIREKLLITPEGKICYNYQGRLCYLGDRSQLVTVLEATTDALLMLDVFALHLPFRYLFIPEQGEWFEEVISYKEIEGGLELQVAPKRWVKCTLRTESYNDPEYGPTSYTMLCRR